MHGRSLSPYYETKEEHSARERAKHESSKKKKGHGVKSSVEDASSDAPPGSTQDLSTTTDKTVTQTFTFTGRRVRRGPNPHIPGLRLGELGLESEAEMHQLGLADLRSPEVSWDTFDRLVEVWEKDRRAGKDKKTLAQQRAEEEEGMLRPILSDPIPGPPLVPRAAPGSDSLINALRFSKMDLNQMDESMLLALRPPFTPRPDDVHARYRKALAMAQHAVHLDMDSEQRMQELQDVLQVPACLPVSSYPHPLLLPIRTCSLSLSLRLPFSAVFAGAGTCH